METYQSLNEIDIEHLAGIFDLLAMFDFEDNKKLALEAGSLEVVAATKESAFGSEEKTSLSKDNNSSDDEKASEPEPKTNEQ